VGSSRPLSARARRLAVVLAVGAFVVGLAPVADGDLWWHLAAGRAIVRTHALLTVDPFSSGAFGRPWVDVHWLFQLAAFGVHAAGGLAALVVVKCALVAAGAVVLLGAVGRSASARARLPFVVALLAALFAARALLLLRPVIPTLVLLAVYFSLLERFRAEGRAALLWPLPFLQILWANLQGLSMLGPALVAAYAVGAGVAAAFGHRPGFPFAERFASRAEARRATRALLLMLGLSVVACGVTPFGFGALALPFKLLLRLSPASGNVYAANVAENVPPFVVERFSPGQFAHLAWYLGLTALALVAARRVLLSHLLVLGGLVALALAANRNVLLLSWLGTPITVIAATPALRRAAVALRRRGTGLPRALRWSTYGALVAVLALASTAAAREPSLAAPAPWRAPVGSARVIAARAATIDDVGGGAIFAADQFGGYLIWTLAPRYKPYMDTRLVLRSTEEFAEYLAIVDDPTRFDAWEQRHPMTYVLLPVGYPDRYLGLVAHLYATARWTLVYTDGAEVLFARREAAPALVDGVDLASPATIDDLRAGVERRFAGAPALAEAGRLQLATLELAVGEPTQAERALGTSRSDDAEALRGRCRLAAGDLDAAARAAESLLARDHDDVRSLDLLAVIEARRGDSTKALALLRRALAVNPFDVEARRILDTWEAPPAGTRD
jgi:hypothetical protein